MVLILMVFFFFFSLFFSSSCIAQQPCSTHNFPNTKQYAACSDLPTLNSSLHWNYHPSTHEVDIAFRHSGNSDSRWIAWAINPTSTHMIGSQALVAFKKSDGTLAAYTSSITSYETQLQEGNLSFAVHGVSALFEDNEIAIFATLELPSNTTIVNHLWQEGPLSGDTPMMHGLSGANLESYGTVDFISGKIETAGIGSSPRMTLKIAHGGMNALSWGFLMPIGAVIARYVKVFQVANPAWFYMHVTCQCVAYVIGIGGSIIGFYLGGKSSGIQYSSHRNIGIALLVLATSQIGIARFRPHPEDKRRLYFNIFHHSVGYATIALSIANCFKGFAILESLKVLKMVYIAIIASLGCVAVLLEAFTWFLVLRRKHASNIEAQAR
ncbi:Cytochrom_B561 domain-containing protein/DUF568 domain-containing protein [Cephalotus follicularis]|uniref:Cytochrome b561 and DOMON domain-containing protein n=1 Tax=Cephalotus follicularis TaxID=3775 RepID=A0A1Q3DGG3_CEPFO|nr:Cytochrom_B561 domain-containing protein/DUF568 domain-containing protein [Cephalotus follicularis]